MYEYAYVGWKIRQARADRERPALLNGSAVAEKNANSIAKATKMIYKVMRRSAPFISKSSVDGLGWLTNSLARIAVSVLLIDTSTVDDKI